MAKFRFNSLLKNYEEFIQTKGSGDISSQLVTLVFAVFLIGGIVYLTTGLEKDYQRYIEMYEPIINELAELQKYELMSDIITSNWYLNEENQQAELALVGLVFVGHRNGEMSEEFQNEAEAWCAKANVESSSDLVRIKEYSFTSEPLSQYQKRHILIIEDFQSRTSILCDYISDWNTLSVEQKDDALATLISTDEASKVVFAQFEEIARINELEIQRRIEENEATSSRAERLRLLMLVKVVASLGGMSIGIITILLFFRIITFAPDEESKVDNK